MAECIRTRPHAPALAALGRPIWSHLKAVRDELGGLMPIRGFGAIGWEEIERETVRSIDGIRPDPDEVSRSLDNCESAEATAKVAYVVQHGSRTQFLAIQLAEIAKRAEGDAERLHHRYQ